VTDLAGDEAMPMPDYPEYRPGPPPGDRPMEPRESMFQNPVYEPPRQGGYAPGMRGEQMTRQAFGTRGLYWAVILAAGALAITLLLSVFVDTAGGLRALRFFAGLAILGLAVVLVGGAFFGEIAPDIVRAGMLVAGAILLTSFISTMLSVGTVTGFFP